MSTLVASDLFLVPLEIWKEDKADVRIWIFINDPFSLCLLLQDVVNPLQGKNQGKVSNVHSKEQTGAEEVLQRD